MTKKSLSAYMLKVDTILLLTMFTLASLTVVVYAMVNPDQALRKGRTPRSSRSRTRGKRNADEIELDADTLEELKATLLTARANQLNPAY